MAPNLVRFQVDSSPIGRITPGTAGLVISLTCLGMLLGTLFFGFLADQFGRKWPLLGVAVPHMVASGCLLFGTNAYHVFASRVAMGFSCGGYFNVLPMFVSEISQKR